jgi:glycosyltransferase involved in cell wall biosynthesis
VGDGPERPHLEDRVAARGLGEKVIFLGQVPDIASALERFDVFVLTSRYEGLPISLLEAMSTGLPVVGTAVGGIPEAVEEGVSGFLVERQENRAATAACLAARLAELLRDGELRRRMGEAGRSRVQKEFSSRTAGRRMLKLYQRELAGRRGARV